MYRPLDSLEDSTINLPDVHSDISQTEAQKRLEQVHFIDPEVFDGPMSFDDPTACSDYMRNHNRVAIVDTVPNLYGFRSEAYSREIVRFDSGKDAYVPDGFLLTEQAEPFVGDQIMYCSGSVVLCDSSQGVGIELHPADAVLLYDRDSGTYSNDEMRSEVLKRAAVSVETHSQTNTVYMTKKLGRMMIKEMAEEV